MWIATTWIWPTKLSNDVIGTSLDSVFSNCMSIDFSFQCFIGRRVSWDLSFHLRLPKSSKCSTMSLLKLKTDSHRLKFPTWETFRIYNKLLKEILEINGSLLADFQVKRASPIRYSILCSLCACSTIRDWNWKSRKLIKLS